MRSFEMVSFGEQEVVPADNLLITLEDGLAERIPAVGFSVPKFHIWTKERGLKDPENHPLIININEKSPLDIDDPEHSSNGTLRFEDGRPNIDLYIGRRLCESDKYANKYSAEARQFNFNKLINKTLVHEIDHFVEVSQGELILATHAQVVLEGICEYASTGKTMTSEEIDAKMAAFKKEYDDKHEEEKYQLYRSQPHEVKAREASTLYTRSHGHMIWLPIKPLAK